MAQYRIDGQVYTADTPDQAYAMHDAAQTKSPGNFSGILQHFNQGLSMGGADEIQAGAESAFGDGTYDESLKRQERERKAYAKEHPYLASTAVGLGAVAPVAASTILGTLAGPEGTVAGVVGSGGRALSMIRQALYGGGEAMQGANTIRQGITQGAKSGVIPGMVAGDLSADQDNRIMGTLEGGATGAGLGGGVGGTAVALPRAMAAGGRVVKAIDDWGMGNVPRGGGPESGALMPTRAAGPQGSAEMPPITTSERKILEAMQEGGVSPEQALAIRARARDLGVPLGLIDIGGPNMQRLARGVRTAGGEAGTTIDTALADRARGQGDRAVNYLQRALGRRASGNAEGMLDNLLTQARNDSSPYYNQLRQLPPITDENVGQVFQTPAVRDIVQNAERTRAQWARPGSQPRPPMYGENGQMLRQPTFEDVDMVKQSIDEMLSPAYQRNARPQESVDISTRLPRGLATTARNDLVAAADAAPSGDIYASARRSYAGPAQARDMYEQGLGFPEASLEDVRSSTANASPAELKWLQRGRVEALRKGIKSMPDLTSQPNTLRSFGGNPEARDRLAAAVPENRQQNLMDRFWMENNAAQTSNFVRGGSNSADKLVDAGDVAGDMAKAAGAGPKNLAAKIVGEAWGAMRSAVSRETRSQIAQHLTNFGDPRQQLAFLSRLQALQAQGRLTSQAIDVAAHTAIQEQGTN